MKKTLAIAAMVAMVPFAAHAKSAISDGEMNKVTGQAGVSIDMDIRMDVSADTIAWGNSDGTNTNWIGMKGFGINNMTVKLRPDLLGAVVISTLMDKGADAAGLKAGYAATGHTGADLAAYSAAVDQIAFARTPAGGNATTAYFESKIKPLTIDVATAAAVDGNKAANTTYVRIGLGSLEVAASSIDFAVALGQSAGTAAPTAANLSQELGSVHMGNLKMEINGSSTVDIYSTTQKAGPFTLGAGSGVVFDLAVTIDKLTADSLSWGNTAGSVTGPSTNALGAPASTTAGYVGLANLNIANLTLTGPVSIQVATVATAAADVATAATALATANAAFAAAPGAATGAAAAVALSTYYYSLYNTIGTGKAMGSSFVHIGLGTGNSMSGSALAANSGGFVLGMGSMTADVKVASNADLTGGGTYGSMGINNLKVGMNGWVNFGTH